MSVGVKTGLVRIPGDVPDEIARAVRRGFVEPLRDAVVHRRRVLPEPRGHRGVPALLGARRCELRGRRARRGHRVEQVRRVGRRAREGRLQDRRADVLLEVAGERRAVGRVGREREARLERGVCEVERQIEDGRGHVVDLVGRERRDVDAARRVVSDADADRDVTVGGHGRDDELLAVRADDERRAVRRRTRELRASRLHERARRDDRHRPLALIIDRDAHGREARRAHRDVEPRRLRPGASRAPRTSSARTAPAA